MTNDQNHIHLLGDPLENFYILGKKDKSSFEEIYQQLSMLCARNKSMAKILKVSTEFSTQLSKKPQGQFHEQLAAYSEGLERPVNDIMFSLLLPEVVASFNKWVPNLMGLIPGCSSLFYRCPQSNDIIHGRILDYALSGAFEKHERSILYEFAGKQKVFSYSTSGMPFPSLSSMNESGLSLALHYKHGQHFNLEGDSIFEITQDIILNCKDIREAIKLIKGRKSISYWGIYLADKNGEVASIDIKGNEIYQEKFDLKDHGYIYFNNRPLLKQKDQSAIQPYGNHNQCHMRREIIESDFDLEKVQKSKKPLIDVLKSLGKAHPKKAKTAKNWKLSPTNPGSIQLVGFNNSKEISINVPGMAPKFFENHYHQYSNIFSGIKFSVKEKKQTGESLYIRAHKELAKFQSALDLNEVPQAYHHIQMAMAGFKGYPELYITKFFYTVVQYIYESDKRDHTYLFQDFLGLKEKLPEYLEDHLELFLLRTGKIIGHKSQDQSENIKHEKLRELYQHEFKLNSLAIKGLKQLIFPRVEILDIIYSY